MTRAPAFLVSCAQIFNTPWDEVFTVWLVSKCTHDVQNHENIGMRHINVLPMTSRTRIHAVWLHTFSWSGAIEVTILEVHLRDQMTLSCGSMRGLVPKIKNDSFDPKSWLLNNRLLLMGGLILKELKRIGTLNSWRAQKTPARMHPEKSSKKFRKLSEI